MIKSALFWVVQWSPYMISASVTVLSPLTDSDNDCNHWITVITWGMSLGSTVLFYWPGCPPPSFSIRGRSQEFHQHTDCFATEPRLPVSISIVSAKCKYLDKYRALYLIWWCLCSRFLHQLSLKIEFENRSYSFISSCQWLRNIWLFLMVEYSK